MTGQQLQRLLDSHGFNQSSLARSLQINPRTVRTYIATEGDIPIVVEFAARWLAHLAKEYPGRLPKV